MTTGASIVSGTELTARSTIADAPPLADAGLQAIGGQEQLPASTVLFQEDVSPDR